MSDLSRADKLGEHPCRTADQWRRTCLENDGQNLLLSYMNRLQGHAFFKCTAPLLFVCGDLFFVIFFFIQSLLSGMSASNMELSDAMYKQKQGKKVKGKQRKMIACASRYL